MTMPSYPQNPYPYQGGPAPVAAKPKPPGTVTGALIIYVLAAVAAVVNVFVAVNSDIWSQALADSGAGNVSSLVSTAKTIAIVVGVVIAALYLFFAFMMWAGRNWARIVLTVISALGIASAFRASATVTVGTHTYTSTSNGGISYASAGLALLAIILMYVGGSNAYFRAAKAYRQGPRY